MSEKFVPGRFWVFFYLGRFCAGKILCWEDFVLGRFCTGKILYWVDFVCLFTWEDFVLGRFWTWRFCAGRFCVWGDFVPGRLWAVIDMAPYFQSCFHLLSFWKGMCHEIFKKFQSSIFRKRIFNTSTYVYVCILHSVEW